MKEQEVIRAIVNLKTSSLNWISRKRFAFFAYLKDNYCENSFNCNNLERFSIEWRKYLGITLVLVLNLVLLRFQT